MQIKGLALDGVLLIEPDYFEDYRGYYCETYSSRTLKDAGIETEFVQDNHFLSIKRGTIRGIHFQNVPKAQAKLLRCTRGCLLDIVVDLRMDSPSYQKWVSVILSEENRKQIYIPKGFGHGCISLTDYTEGQYKVNALYEPALDRAIRWNDPDLHIQWGIGDVIVSEKDAKAPLLCESDVNFTMENTR